MLKDTKKTIRKACGETAWCVLPTQHLDKANQRRIANETHYKLWFADVAIHCSQFLMSFHVISTQKCVSWSFYPTSFYPTSCAVHFSLFELKLWLRFSLVCFSVCVCHVNLRQFILDSHFAHINMHANVNVNRICMCISLKRIQFLPSFHAILLRIAQMNCLPSFVFFL